MEIALFTEQNTALRNEFEAQKQRLIDALSSSSLGDVARSHAQLQLAIQLEERLQNYPIMEDFDATAAAAAATIPDDRLPILRLDDDLTQDSTEDEADSDDDATFLCQDEEHIALLFPGLVKEEIPANPPSESPAEMLSTYSAATSCTSSSSSSSSSSSYCPMVALVPRGCSELKCCRCTNKL